MTAPHIVRIGHVILAVTDLVASRHFYVDLLGMHVLHESEGALFLRGVEDREWSLKLEQAAAPGVRQIAFKVGADSVIEELRDFAAHHSLSHAMRTERDRPALLRVEDPFGFPMAFYYESVRAEWLMQQYHLHRGPGIVRIDHVNLFTPNVGAMATWYTDHLGFRLTEFTDDDTGALWAAWMQRKGNVHDIALTNGTGPRLHHFAYWLPDASRILQLCDILAGAREEAHIERGPGRHGIANAFFLYLRDPDGHRIELYTSDYLTVDPDFEPIRWHRDDPRRQQLWGGLAPKSWFTEGSRVETLSGEWADVRESALGGLPDYIA